MKSGGLNVARFFVTYRSVGWVLLVATLVWGAMGYLAMPKRKDPYFKIRQAVAVAIWPGAPPEQMEKLVVEPMEAKLAGSTAVKTLEASARTGVAVLNVSLREDFSFEEMQKQFDDIESKLRDVELPSGAAPIRFEKDFGDTNVLLYSIGSPKVGDAELDARALELRRALPPGESAYVVPFPLDVPTSSMRAALLPLAKGVGAAEVKTGPGFALVSAAVPRETLARSAAAFAENRPSVHPDAWPGFTVDAKSDVRAQLARVRGDAYSLAELDRFAEALKRRVRGTPGVAKVIESGVVPERFYVEFDRTEIEASGIALADVARAINAKDPSSVRATTSAGGRTLAIDTSGMYIDAASIAETVIARSATGQPVRLGDRFDVVRGYEDPRRTSHTLTARDASGRLVRSHAVTIGVQQLPDAQIADVGARVERTLDEARRSLPPDLRIEKLSDQPKQVEEKVGSFVRSLFEAVVIVIVVGFVGFWEWRSATVLALSIPVTLAMTFGLMNLFHLDIQQISLAALIISLGLLVDDPVVANDAIRSELDRGVPRNVAAWLGPQKLATAILFATLTNIAAYLPFLLNGGDVGRYIYALPIVLTLSLIASRVVSMTFIPLFGYVFLRASRRSARIAQRADGRVARAYRKLIDAALRRRWAVLAVAGVFLALCVGTASRLRLLFFPKDLMFQAYVDVFLPEDATLETTERTLAEAEDVLAEVDDEIAIERGHHVLTKMAAWAGAPAPRFWYSLSPKESYPSYGQVVFEVSDAHATEAFVNRAQKRLSSRLAGARVDVKMLENGPPLAWPVELRVSGENPAELREIADRLLAAIRPLPEAARVRDDWGTDALRIRLRVDDAIVAESGVANGTIATAAAMAFNGMPVGHVLSDRRIPVLLRERRSDKAAGSDVDNLGVPTAGGWIPVTALATKSVVLGPERIARRNQARTMTVIAFPAAGVLASELMRKVHPALDEVRKQLPPGYRVDVGGAEEKTNAVLLDSSVVAIVSVLAIYGMLLLQFRSARKPFVVLAAIPFGVAGGIASIVAMGAPFGFTGILGTVSLIGVIVSHVIVLFDGIDHEERAGTPLREALVTAGVQRLRPVAITVGATVLGLVPLALHGGPLWEPLCYAQIGGLTIATVVTLLIVPVIYAIFVEDLRILRWGGAPTEAAEEADRLLLRRVDPDLDLPTAADAP